MGCGLTLEQLACKIARLENADPEGLSYLSEASDGYLNISNNTEFTLHTLTLTEGVWLVSANLTYNILTDAALFVYGNIIVDPLTAGDFIDYDYYNSITTGLGAPPEEIQLSDSSSIAKIIVVPSGGIDVSLAGIGYFTASISRVCGGITALKIG